MIRRQRNYLPHLFAEWHRMFPARPDKKDFDDEIVCAVNFLMRQIDPEGRNAVFEPPMPAEGYIPQPGVRGKTKGEDVEG